jgi:hypothetical protein
MTARHVIRRVGTSAALIAALAAGTIVFPASLKAATTTSFNSGAFCGYVATAIGSVQHLKGPFGSLLLKWLQGIYDSYCS